MKLPARIMIATGRDGSRVQIEITDTTSGVVAADRAATLADAGRDLGVSAERARQVEARALDAIRRGVTFSGPRVDQDGSSGAAQRSMPRVAYER